MTTSTRAGRRPAGHWTHPISPLQAARFAKHETLEQAAAGIAQICPGHVRSGTRHPCEMSGGLLNDYERGARRPGLDHLQVLCDYYEASAEDLGVIKVTWEPAAAGTGTVEAIGTHRGYRDGDTTSQSATLGGDGGEAAPFAELFAMLLLEEGPGGEGSDEVQRRLFLERIMATVASASAVDPFVRVARHVRDRLLTTKVSDRDVDDLEQAAFRHARTYPGDGTGSFARNLAVDWAAAGQKLNLSQTPSQRVRLSAAYARLSGILSAVAHTGGNPRRAISLLESGRYAAREAGEQDLLGWLYGRHGLVLSYYGGDPGNVVELTAKGLAAATGGTTTTAWLHAAMARAHADLGNRPEAMAALNEAERTLGTASPGCWGEAGDSLTLPRGFLFSPDRLAFYTGETLVRLGDDAATVRSCAYTTALQDRLHHRDTGEKPLNRLNLALATLRRGDLDEAHAIATEAIGNEAGYVDKIVVRRARTFSTALSRHGTTRQASDFADQLRLRDGQLPPSAVA